MAHRAPLKSMMDHLKNPTIDDITIRNPIDDIREMYPSMINYAKFDCVATQKLWDIVDREIERRGNMSVIKDVVFNPPATIVFWSDGTKTVVKCGKYEDYDPEKGLAMAISKRVLGNKGYYYNLFSKWLGKYEVKPTVTVETACINVSSDAIRKAKKAFSEAFSGLYFPVTEHYGYVRVNNVYKVCHKDEAYILRATPGQDWSPAGCNEASAHLICEALERKHYGNATEG